MSKWIPCSERLPEDNRDVLASVCLRIAPFGKPIDIISVAVAWYEDNSYWDWDLTPIYGKLDGNDKHIVEAWQELPEPWEGEGNG